MVAVSSTPATRYVVFTASGQTLALPADAVRSFLPLPRLHRLPAGPALVEGFFRYQGEVVVVLRLDGLLGLPRSAGNVYAPLLLLKGRTRPVALLVDRVHDIALAKPGEVLDADPAMSLNGCAVAALSGGESLAAILSADRLLTEIEDRLLAELQAAEAERLSQWSAQAGQALP